jgi:hypothetical protein
MGCRLGNCALHMAQGRSSTHQSGLSVVMLGGGRRRDSTALKSIGVSSKSAGWLSTVMRAISLKLSGVYARTGMPLAIPAVSRASGAAGEGACVPTVCLIPTSRQVARGSRFSSALIHGV